MVNLDKYESDIGSKVEDLLETVLKVKYLRIPDSVFGSCFHKFSKVNGKTRREISKYLKAWPDYLIFRNEGEYCNALLLELKRDKKSMLSPEQRALREVLNIKVAKSWWSAKHIILDWHHAKQ